MREHDRRLQLRPATAHRMAILAMDQLGWLLGDLVPRAEICRELDRAVAVARTGRAAILLPSAPMSADPLPASWAVTSDLIAAWVAGACGATRLVLVKAIDGLWRDWPPRGAPLARVTVADLAALQAAGRAAGVDRHFPTALAAAGVEAWMIGGSDPERLAALLDGHAVPGTLITPA